MPRMLRKGGENKKATMALHQINVDQKVKEVLQQFKSESRTRKRQRAVENHEKVFGKNEDGAEPEFDDSFLNIHTHDEGDLLARPIDYPYERKNLKYKRTKSAASRFQNNLQGINMKNRDHEPSGKIVVNEDFKGAQVTFDENVTHQMNVINGIAPKENVLVRALVGTLSRKIIDEIGEQTV